MTFKQIRSDIFRHNFFIFPECCPIDISHFSGNLVADMKQLTKVHIIFSTGLIMSKSLDILFTGPLLEIAGKRKSIAVDIDNRDVRDA